MIPDELRERYTKLCEEYKALHGKMRKLEEEFLVFFERGGELAQKAKSANDAYLEIRKDFKGSGVQLKDMESKLMEMGELGKVFMVGYKEFIVDNRKLLDKVHKFQDVIKRAGEELLKGKATRRQMGKVMDKLEKGFENIKANYAHCHEALDERETGYRAMARVYDGLVN